MTFLHPPPLNLPPSLHPTVCASLLPSLSPLPPVVLSLWSLLTSRLFSCISRPYLQAALALPYFLRPCHSSTDTHPSSAPNLHRAQTPCPMAAYARSSGRMASFFSDSSSASVDFLLDGQVDPRADTSQFEGKLVSLGDRPASVAQFARDRASNGFSMALDGRVGYLNSEKGMILDTHRHSSREGYFPSGLATTMEGVLDITVHHARDIQNICIYGNQDVYAKFSITQCQDAVYSTQPVKAGGKNPVFKQSLQIPVSQTDAVLKCEIWMMSCARTYLEDQLLGFVLVPLASYLGKGKQTQDYTLTSTDLFHTPAGTVCLSLLFECRKGALDSSSLREAYSKVYTDGILPKSPEVMPMDCGNQTLDPNDYNKIDFPDLQVVSEDQHMVSVYLKMASGDLKLSNGEACLGRKLGEGDGGIFPEHRDLMGAPFLQLGSASMAEVDCEMSINTGEEKSAESAGFASDCQLFDLTSSSSGISSLEAPSSNPTMTAVPHSAGEQNSQGGQELSRASTSVPVTSAVHLGGGAQTTASSGSTSSTAESLDHSSLRRNVDVEKLKETAADHVSEPLVSLALEPEEPVMQQQIVDMYMKSMQQFTESLAKMKLPLDADAQGCIEPRTDTDQKGSEKKEGHRVFYGSRAFF